MEPLPRRKRLEPLIVSKDSSLNLSFKLPASYVSSLHRPSVPLEAVITKEDEENDDSWETKSDFKLDFEQDEDESMDTWQEDVEVFPDNFPLLLVNLSRLSKEHMKQELESNEDGKRVSASLIEVLESNKFSYVIETLFEQEIAHHTTYGIYKSYLEYLSKQSNDVWATVDYPALVDQETPLSELLFVIERPTQWKSVNCIKEYMAKTSRDIKWKAQVLEEVEYLANFEHDAKMNADTQLREKIDQLTELRQVLEKKLATTSASNATGRHLAQLELDDVEKRLKPLLKTFLTPPPEPTKFVDSLGNAATYSKVGLNVENMNVLDMILSMVFSRLPRPPQLALDAHYNSLMTNHDYIRHLWLQDFGRLPPRTQVDEDGQEIVQEEPIVEQAPSQPSGNESDAYKGDEDDSDSEASRIRQAKIEKKKRQKKKKKAKTMAKPIACVSGIALLRLTEEEQQLYG
ncbi:hypothetical protein THRCLA_22166 [Thraustotheca clavata]|uniref:Uncharacterized protein n=1 Tax=Thraustotheca clavata TaxID=74557 RepID=A0A1V9ZBA2_9STRA|nr:hypothetical protein THRCLA_22166 [Thraustotheca clavata]